MSDHFELQTQYPKPLEHGGGRLSITPAGGAIFAHHGREVSMSRVLIELPGPWISHITLSVVEDMKKFLVSEFGPDVNIANVMPADILETEALRVGLGVVGPQVSRSLG